jgi:hypothetical protein
MNRLLERTAPSTRAVPEETILPEPTRQDGRAVPLLRSVGAIAVLIVGAVHLDQYVGVHFNVVPVVGPLFLLNFIGATLIGLGLLLPGQRMRVLHILLALAGIALAATSFVFLFISEHQPLFGFQDYGYRAAILIALAAEAIAAVTLSAYLLVRGTR